MDGGSNFVYLNPKFNELFGYELSDIPSGKEWLRKAFPDPVRRHTVISIWLDDLRSSEPGERRPRIFPVTCKNGAEKLVRFVAVSMVDGGNLLTCEDITESRNSELALKTANDKLIKSIDFFQNIINTISDPIHVKDRNHRIVLVNDASCNIFGLKREDILGKTAYDLFPSRQMADISWQKDEAVFSTGLQNINEEINTYAHGKTRNVLVKKTFFTQGDESFLVGITTDITERKEAEEAYRLLVDNSLQGLALIQDDRIVFANRSFANICGHTIDELLSLTPAQIKASVHVEDRALIWSRYADLLDGGKPPKCEFRLIRKDRSIAQLEINVSLIHYRGRPAVQLAVIDITDRKIAEASLKSAHDQLSGIIDFLPDATFVVDTEKKVIAWNRAMQELTGVDKRDMLNQGNYAYAAPFYGKARPILIDLLDQNNDEIEREYTHVEKEGQTISGETYAPCLFNGKGAHLWAKASALYNRDGQMIGSIESIRDITRRKDTETKLEVAEEKYRLLVENQSEVIYTTDTHGFITYISPVIKKFIGTTFEEIIGRNLSSLICTEDQPRLAAFLQKEIKSQVEYFDFQILGQNQKLIYMRCSCRLLTKGDELLGVSGFISNITEQKLAELELQRKEILLGAAAIATNILLVDTDLDSSISQTIEVLGQSMGIDRVCLCDHGLSKVILEHFKQSYEWLSADTASCMDNFDPHPMPTIAALRRDMLPVKRLIRGTLSEVTESERILLELKSIKSFMAIPISIEGWFWGSIEFHDCHSERVWTGSDINILQLISVSIGGAIGRKYSENELHLAKAAAESATIAKSQFLANMSHEIRTPLNAMIGLTDLLQKSFLNTEQKDYLETIRHSGDMLLSIINNVLDFSKIESDMMELEASPIDLRSLIQKSLDSIAPAASEKGLVLSCISDSNTPKTIMADPIRLGQVLGNLFSNAVKFTENGEVAVSVSSKKQDNGCIKIHFAISDTGSGIPDDKMDRLFQSFSQVDSSTTRKYGGTGLGLAISKKLVELMGGTIWAQSKIGEGSTFHFEIISRSTNLDPIDLGVKQFSWQDVKDQKGKRAMRILLAEDNEINQKVMLHMLSKLGYTADVASNGLEVLRALERQLYDIILMDIQMPEMDGVETAKKIREKWQGKDRPKIVAITAYALQGDREYFLDAGMDRYLSKPVHLDELGAVLSSLQ
jgi:PAS domain S-box-containing protein